MKCISPDVRACGAGQTGSLTLTFAITGSTGRAALERLELDPRRELEARPAEPGHRAALTEISDPETWQCVARAVSRLRFVPLEREKLRIVFPIVLR